MLYPFLGNYGQPLGLTGQSLLQLLFISALLTPLGALLCYVAKIPESTLLVAKLLIVIKAASCLAYMLAPTANVLGAIFVAQGICFFAIVPMLQSLLARLDPTGDSIALCSGALLAAQGIGPLIFTGLLAFTPHTSALAAGAYGAGLLCMVGLILLPWLGRGVFAAVHR
jgi:hypothetical protein